MLFRSLIIFALSLQPGADSTATTGVLSNNIANILNIEQGTLEGTSHGIGGVNIESINLLIRSFAHVLEFGGLGLMIILGCALCKYSQKSTLVLTLIWGSMTALVDEIIKYFIPGRHFNAIDLGKDMIGIFLALLGCWILQLIYKTYIQKSPIINVKTLTSSVKVFVFSHKNI